ncbi:MAG: hypothetical protein KKE02_13140 [Alphaproteobacteria bacterium]|nr:hypothetical protein [Alphaproteobacteria bacterium]MBU1513282.1 hypothetical protein [Alphaproteobacteria bacterium]MBU2093598.1 hypothetical protein [Alphaproteobacteria bacterium]MBU2151958.1 hypothetical protein [Alphaproteobacteria bacterium]MBU2307618.1 hypothetical protein [Alphaproteobacteria bacterium]
MLKTVLWIAAACAAILVALAVSRNLNFDKPVEKAVEPPAVVEAPPPAPVVEAPVAPPPAPKPVERTPEEQQIQDDAAATGMTTVEPDPPTEAPQS